MERFREWVCEMQGEQHLDLVALAVSSTLKEEDIEEIPYPKESR